MFLLSNDYVLGKEVADVAGINIANISRVFNKLKDSGDAIKLGGSIFLKRNAPDLQNNFKKIISKNKLTDLSKSLPLPYLLSELDINEKELLEAFGTNIELFYVSGKTFVRFYKEFADYLKYKTMYTIKDDEFMECMPYIENFIKIKNKIITIY